MMAEDIYFAGVGDVHGEMSEMLELIRKQKTLMMRSRSQTRA
ncbi:MAG: hypothetical protein AB4290_24330 [Spirulina sp.]